MILCIDVGNSHIFGGVFEKDTLRFRFRHTSTTLTSDMLGIFLKQVLLENDCKPDRITSIAVASVVPALDYTLRSACIKYFSLEPFLIQAGIKTGLQIQYRHPTDVGADRIANAIAAVDAFPERPLIVIDFGTATTFCAISAKKVYLGGAILPGVRLSVEALAKNTAKLPSVELVKVKAALGRSTIESIQGGIFIGMVGACREIITRLKKEVFQDAPVTVIATGGWATLFEGEGLFDNIMPDLVLNGLRLAVLNQGNPAKAAIVTSITQ